MQKQKVRYCCLSPSRPPPSPPPSRRKLTRWDGNEGDLDLIKSTKPAFKQVIVTSDTMMQDGEPIARKKWTDVVEVRMRLYKHLVKVSLSRN